MNAFRSGGHLALQAGAGTGRTGTLILRAASAPHRSGRYPAQSTAGSAADHGLSVPVLHNLIG